MTREKQEIHRLTELMIQQRHQGRELSEALKRLEAEGNRLELQEKAASCENAALAENYWELWSAMT